MNPNKGNQYALVKYKARAIANRITNIHQKSQINPINPSKGFLYMYSSRL